MTSAPRRPEEILRPKKPLRRLAWYGTLGIGAVILIGALSWVFGASWFFDRVYKPRIERAFGVAHPGSALRIGHLTYDSWNNRLVGDSVKLSGSNALWNCQI